MSSLASRRALLCGIAALPISGGAAVATEPSDIVKACFGSLQQSAFIEARTRFEEWDDDRLNVECDKASNLFRVAIDEPSRTFADLNAKAQLALYDYREQIWPMLDPDGPREPDDGEKLILVVLQEVIRLCA